MYAPKTKQKNIFVVKKYDDLLVKARMTSGRKYFLEVNFHKTEIAKRKL